MVVRCGLATFLALEGNTVRLPLAAIIGAPARALIRIIKGRRFRPADARIVQPPRTARPLTAAVPGTRLAALRLERSG